MCSLFVQNHGKLPSLLLSQKAAGAAAVISIISHFPIKSYRNLQNFQTQDYLASLRQRSGRVRQSGPQWRQGRPTQTIRETRIATRRFRQIVIPIATTTRQSELKAPCLRDGLPMQRNKNWWRKRKIIFEEEANIGNVVLSHVEALYPKPERPI